MADTVWEAYAKEKERLIELLKDSPSLDALDDYGYAMGADHLIANGVTVTDNNVGGKWIPVTERLPELFEECFVLVKMKYDWEEDYEYNVDAGCYVEENGYIDGFNTYNDWNEGQQYIHVTHWMPLPEAPEGE